jgi:hypothetical protein
MHPFDDRAHIDVMRHRMRFHPLLVIAVAGSLAFACGKPVNRLDPAKLHEITSPASEGSAQANLTVEPGGETYLSWMETNDAGWPALKFTRKTTAGWSAPGTIADGDSMVVNYADYPSLLAIDKKRARCPLVVHDSQRR